MTIQVDVRHRLGAFSLEASFASSGRLIALFGPAGSGKTSLVNLIGGLIGPDEGRIVAGGRVLVDTVFAANDPPTGRMDIFWARPVSEEPDEDDS